MSDERRDTAQRKIQSTYASLTSREVQRDRYLDAIAPLRRIQPALEAFQKGEELLMAKKYDQAQDQFASGLRLAPGDYAGLLLAAKCRLAREHYAESAQLAREAQSAYPGEPQAHHVTGLALAKNRRFEPALTEFNRYAELLPGNPFTLFYQGFCQEGMNRRPAAAEAYQAFLKQVDQGEEAQHAYRRLVEWGYIQKSK